MPNFPRELRQFMRENGIQWTLLFCVNRFVRKVEQATDARLQTLEQRGALPGTNTIARNRALWSGYDWTEKGENWTPSAEWKQALIDDVLLRYLGDAESALEIGPGAGRWTQVLQSRVAHLTVVDVSERCLEMCRQRFANANNIRFLHSSGSDLKGVADGSIDFIWSFDVFVHINPVDTESYLAEFRRVLRPGGAAVIHHPKFGRSLGGYRSSMTGELFIALVKKHGLRFIRQFDSWGLNGAFDVRLHRDAITLFAR